MPELLYGLAQRTPNAIIITDAQRRTLWVNGGFTRITGYTLEDMAGRVPGHVLFSEKTDPRTIQAMFERLSSGRAFQGELLNRTKDGRDYWVFVDMQPRHDDRGNLVGFVAVETDISERKLSQLEHEHVLAELAGFFESSAELLCITDANGTITKMNDAWARILGVNIESMLNRSLLDLVHPADVDQTRRWLESLEDDCSASVFANRCRVGEEPWRTLEWRASRRGDRVYAAARDLTEHHRMERLLLEQAERTELALSVGRLGTWEWDVQSGALSLDDQWTRDFIEPAGDAEHVTRWSSRVHREDVVPTLRRLSMHLRGRGPFEDVVFRMRQYGGGWRWIRASGRVVEFDARGKPLRMVGTHADVTDQESAQLRLREANEKMDLALQAGRMGLWMWDLDTGRFSFDERWCAMMGERAGDLLDDATTLLTRVHPIDIVSLETAIERHSNGALPHVDTQFRIRHRDGTWRWVRMFGKATHAMGRQQVHRLVGIQMDVHDQVEAQNELARREMVLANTVRITAIGGWEYDVATERLYWSDQVCAIHEVPGTYVPTLERAVDFYEEPSRSEIIDAVQRGMEHGESWDLECRFVTAKGRRRWVRAVGEPVYQDGRVVRLVGAFQDVTEERAQRDALESSNRALEVAQSIARMGSWSYDARSEGVTWSRQLFELFELDPELVVPTSEVAIGCYRSEDAERLRIAIERAKEQGTPYALTLERNNPTNGVRYVAVEGRARCDAEGCVTGLFGTARDVTAEVEREAELHEAKLRAEDANRSKTEFLANMSHEIRTPMTAILGYAELLDDPTLPAQDRATYLDTIKRNGEHLLTILNDILDVSKIESGRMGVECIGASPVQILRSVGQLMSVNARSKAIDFSMRCMTPVPETVRTDPTRLRQILVNLVGNALKFTSQGRVRVSMSFEQASDGGVLHIAVEDTGIGMTPEQLNRVFSAFTQADASMTRRFGGTGLGLLISKRLAEMLHGDISVESEAGRGSTFTLSIRVEATDDVHAIPAGPIELHKRADADPTKRQGPLAGVRVLLIEDGPDNLRLIQTHLARAGASVYTARDGLEGVELLTARKGGQQSLRTPLPVDVIVTDMQMPRMDGYAVARLLRRLGCDLPIVALTAHAMRGDRERCIDAGCDAYLEKPVDRERLVATINQSRAGREAA